MHVVVDERLPEPTRLTLTVVGLLHPAESVLLPLSPGATTTMVAAGVLPVPLYDKVTVRWLLSTMLKLVTLTLAMVLAALKDVNVPFRSCQASGPGPLQPSHCPLRLLVEGWFGV